MQASGEGLRIRTIDIRAIFEDSAELRSYVLGHIQLQIYAMSRASACNALHEAEQRLSRWLLTAADVSKTDVMDAFSWFGFRGALGSGELKKLNVHAGLKMAAMIEMLEALLIMAIDPSLNARRESLVGATRLFQS